LTGKLNFGSELGDILNEEAAKPLALEVRGLHKSYSTPNGPLAVLCGVDLEVAPGCAVAIIGASGVGKSTLLHVLGALDTPDSGQVLVAGEDPFAVDEDRRALLRNRKIGFVFQFHHLLPEFSAVENVALPLWVGKWDQAEALAVAHRVLDDLGMEPRAWARPETLSGGERQRVALARALVSSPALILADEPTGNLDAATARMVYERMVALARERQTALVVATHDMELAVQADFVLRLREGRLSPE
jgi:lipoprotein-releasing system ATP-binding protein